MTDILIIQRLSDGHSIVEISKEMDVTERAVEYKLEVLKKRLNCRTLAHLVANYLRKKLIE